MSLVNAIGNTPLVELSNIWDARKTGVRMMAKLEGANPGGSIKDRPAYYMIRKAIERGDLTKDRTILEPTSGNTGIGMAMIAAAMGYKIKLMMPACVSEERRSVLMALGAELELTPGCDRTDGAITRAHHVMEMQGDRYYMPNQFDNDANWQAHYETTAPEIVRDTKGEVDLVAAGMGTTGTLMGCSRYFRDHHPRTRVLGVEPTLNHRIQGLKNMSESIVPGIYTPELIDRQLMCSDDNAFETGYRAARRCGGPCRRRATFRADRRWWSSCPTAATGIFRPRSSGPSARNAPPKRARGPIFCICRGETCFHRINNWERPWTRLRRG